MLPPLLHNSLSFVHLLLLIRLVVKEAVFPSIHPTCSFHLGGATITGFLIHFKCSYLKVGHSLVGRNEAAETDTADKLTAAVQVVADLFQLLIGSVPLLSGVVAWLSSGALKADLVLFTDDAG